MNGSEPDLVAATGPSRPVCGPHQGSPGHPRPAESPFLEWLRHDRTRREFEASVALVVAHPDDEVIGAGALLPRLNQLSIIHATDGSPNNLSDATRSGCASRAEYAEARRLEFENSMRWVGPVQHRVLPFVDQEASFHLMDLTRRITDVLLEFRPQVMLTHPYEGGHPDHDATAFAAHAASQLVGKRGIAPPELIEMTSYHNRAGVMETGTFLPGLSSEVTEVMLTEAEQQTKRQMLQCFRSQQTTLSAFATDAERFRLAPAYDFTQPPHPGTLFYELFNWGVRGVAWRQLACQALQELDLTGAI